MTAQLYGTIASQESVANFEGTKIKWLALYKSDPTLIKGFNPALLTECDFSNYARIDISAGWGAAAIDGNGNGAIVNTLRTFTKTGATPNPTVYGFFYVDTDGTTVRYAQRFADAPYAMTLDGDLIRITPQFVVGGPVFA
jgi:hypothetical protein